MKYALLTEILSRWVITHNTRNNCLQPLKNTLKTK